MRYKHLLPLVSIALFLFVFPDPANAQTASPTATPTASPTPTPLITILFTPTPSPTATSATPTPTPQASTTATPSPIPAQVKPTDKPKATTAANTAKTVTPPKGTPENQNIIAKTMADLKPDSYPLPNFSVDMDQSLAGSLTQGKTIGKIKIILGLALIGLAIVVIRRKAKMRKKQTSDDAWKSLNPQATPAS